jgi:hypothetical protein
LDKTDEHAQSLSQYDRQGNRMLFDCLDEIIDRISKNKKRPGELQTKAMGSYQQH